MSNPFSNPFPSPGRRRGGRRSGPGFGPGFGPAFAPGFRPDFRPGFFDPFNAPDGPGEPGGAPRSAAGPGEGRPHDHHHEHHHEHHREREEEDVEFGPGFRPRGGRRGFGRGPFGPFGPMGGMGPFGPGFERAFERGRGHGRGRGRRPNVRAAVLALLAEEPRHGYAIMNELAERSGGLWRPSPGSVYPVLQQLQDEGLVLVEEADGRRIFTLSEAGRAYVAEHQDELQEPWRVAENGPVERVQKIMFSMQALGGAVQQIARLADDEQAEQAVAALDEARRKLYRILGGEAG